jgi:hypothetical protein
MTEFRSTRLGKALHGTNKEFVYEMRLAIELERSGLRDGALFVFLGAPLRYPINMVKNYFALGSPV